MCPKRACPVDARLPAHLLQSSLGHPRLSKRVECHLLVRILQPPGTLSVSHGHSITLSLSPSHTGQSEAAMAPAGFATPGVRRRRPF